MIKNRMKFSVMLPFVVFSGLAISSLGAHSKDDSQERAGNFSILTYNVAGLPEGISSSHPIKNTSMISPRLNAFDIVLVQEDFSYHKKLRSKAEHPYISGPGTDGILGDGLGRFSNFSMTEVEHVAWEECYGTLGYANDCLTPKGFSSATHEIAPGVFMDIYNLHMDAGSSPGDRAARAVQMDQLIAAIRKKSAGKAVIVAGDWNLSGTREKDLALLDKLLTGEQLTDSCRSLSCGEERIDRILFRGNDSIKLKAVVYKVELDRFTNKKGKPLSDHDAVSVVFEWEYTGE